MKMKKLLLTYMLIYGLQASAQNYTISPASTITVNAPFNTLSIFDIYQDNTASTKILLRWTLISNGLVAGWDYSLCDYGHCVVGLPPSGTMDSVPVASQGFLGLNINPYSIPGTGIVKIYVYEDGFSSLGDTLTWVVNAGPDGVAELNSSAQLSVFPNPAADLVNISVLNSSSRLNFSIYNSLGDVVYTSSLEPADLLQFNSSAVSNGMYFIRLFDSNNAEIGRRKLIISR